VVAKDLVLLGRETFLPFLVRELHFTGLFRLLCGHVTKVARGIPDRGVEHNDMGSGAPERIYPQ
jgi:hypothetical protein